MYSKISSKTLFIIFSVIASLMLCSCSGGGSSGADAGADTDTVRSVYTGNFNVNNGQYTTCTLDGNEQGGTITLSNGTMQNLTGSYNSGSSRAVYKMEGYYTVSFNGISRSYSYSIIIDADLFAIREVSGTGTEKIYAGGTENSVYIVAGSADDPFNGTKWTSFPPDLQARQPSGTLSNSGSLLGKFSNGFCETFTLSGISCQYPYQVLKTSNGYEAIIVEYENRSREDYYFFVNKEYVIADKNAEEINVSLRYISSHASLNMYVPIGNGGFKLIYE